MKSLPSKIANLACAIALTSVAGLVEKSDAAVTVDLQNSFSATTSGTLNGVPFNTNFTITGNYQSTAIENGNQGLHSYSVDYSSCSIELAGLGTYQFITTLRTFVTGDIVGLSRGSTTGNDLIDFNSNPAAATWNLDTSFPTFTQSVSLIQWSVSPVETTGGTLVFDSQKTSVTFQVVPESSSLAVATLGGLLAVRRRR